MDKQPWNCRLAFAFLHPLTLPLERVMHQVIKIHRIIEKLQAVKSGLPLGAKFNQVITDFT
jgi:hypothetical protein